MIKLSDCTEEGQVFLYGGETVGLQYVLNAIYNGEKLPEIKLVDDESFNNAISDVLHQMYKDFQNGTNRDNYELNGLNPNIVVVDITKEEIVQLDGEDYSFEMKRENK